METIKVTAYDQEPSASQTSSVPNCFTINLPTTVIWSLVKKYAQIQVKTTSRDMYTLTIPEALIPSGNLCILDILRLLKDHHQQTVPTAPKKTTSSLKRVNSPDKDKEKTSKRLKPNLIKEFQKVVSPPNTLKPGVNTEDLSRDTAKLRRRGVIGSPTSFGFTDLLEAARADLHTQKEQSS